jgi:hypothetical protein
MRSMTRGDGFVTLRSPSLCGAGTGLWSLLRAAGACVSAVGPYLGRRSWRTPVFSARICRLDGMARRAGQLGILNLHAARGPITDRVLGSHQSWGTTVW